MRSFSRSRRGLLVVATVIAGFSVSWASLGGGAFASSTTTSTVAPSTSTTTVTVPSTSTTTVTVAPKSPTTTTTAKPRPAPTLRLGETGASVLALQRRLTSLGYWLGQPNGIFADSTQQAVYALQKAASIQRDGAVGPVTAAALKRGVRPKPWKTSGYVVEVNLNDDLLMIVRNGSLVWTFNTSTGGGYTYVDEGVTAIAETPRGIFHVYRAVDGIVTDSLGQLWRPRYFDGGFAIHGDSYVPASPVSHGCVRVSNEAIDWIWANNLLPLGTKVWVYS